MEVEPVEVSGLLVRSKIVPQMSLAGVPAGQLECRDVVPSRTMPVIVGVPVAVVLLVRVKTPPGLTGVNVSPDSVRLQL